MSRNMVSKSIVHCPSGHWFAPFGGIAPSHRQYNCLVCGEREVLHIHEDSPQMVDLSELDHTFDSSSWVIYYVDSPLHNYWYKHLIRNENDIEEYL